MLYFSYGVFYCVAAFVAYCISLGIFNVAENVEKNPLLAQRIFRYLFISVAVMLLINMIVDELPYFLCGILFAQQYLASLIIMPFPNIQWKNWKPVAFVILFIVANVKWYFYLMTLWEFTDLEVFCFFCFYVWLTPFCIFVSLPVNEYVLPSVYE
jgi:hypothetical protein